MARNRTSLIQGFASRAVTVVAMFGVSLFACGISPAQSSGAAPAKAVMQSPAAARTAPAVPAPSVPAVTPAAKPGGVNTEVGVHGHWMIEVRNPDGKVASHVEFENGVCTAGSGGASTLAELLNGSSAPGGWSVSLGNSALPQPIPSGGLCGASGSTVLTIVDGNSVTQTTACTENPNCFPMLGVSLPVVQAGNPIHIQLAGQFAVPATISATQITNVATAIVLCHGSAFFTSTSAFACSEMTGQAIIPFSGVWLSGTGGVPGPITVGPGQTVAFTVQLSFQ